MTWTKTEFRFLPPVSLPAAGAAALLLAVALVGADLATGVWADAAILYGLPLLVVASARSRPLLWGLTAFLTAATFLVWLWERNQVVADVAAVVLVNRVLAALDVLCIAVMLHLGIRAADSLDAQHRALEKQNEELETVNQELGQREEEIVRQNEELQSQTEELERQSEELRVTNEELANHERTLEQLLELSRALTAELGRKEVMQKICEALGVLADGWPSAIVERQGDQLVIPCYHGFGPDGLEAEAIPFDRSFTSLILALGQAGYLEDTRLRPDLVFPRPKGGEPVRAVLSAPLRVRGQCIGAVELYATTPQSWGEGQIAMLESLAAQTSISLQNLELVEVIRQERRRFEAALRTVPLAIAVAEDAEGTQVRLNPAAAAQFGVPSDENVALATPAGARLKRYLFRGDRRLADEDLPLVRALRGEEVHGEELDVVLPANRRLTLLTSAAPIFDGKGRVAGAVCALADITAHKALQRELDLRRREAEEASVRKTRFLASVSHDIRTPVNAINLMAEVIRRSVDNPALVPQIPQMAQRLQANALALADLVTDVLDVARFDFGKVELQETEFSLGDLLTEECRHLLPLAQDKNLELLVEPPERPVWMRSDRVKLARVVGNLVSNAIKFTEAGHVRVSAALGPNREVVIRVADTGVGIAAEHLGHIFDEFAQLRNPERNRDKGSGLGLAICRRLVDVMGGTITVDSGLGRGSVFTVRLPSSCVVMRLGGAAERDAAPRRARPARGTLLAGLRILLVEDHSTTRETTAQILLDEGATVREAADGGTAQRFVLEEPWDVILLDMMLPDVDGREILKQVGARRPAALKAVVVMTGDLTSERQDEVKQLGADALVGKPIDVDRLIEMLQTLQGRPQDG
jgi:PAS domain S-box-containing protein